MYILQMLLTECLKHTQQLQPSLPQVQSQSACTVTASEREISGDAQLETAVVVVQQQPQSMQTAVVLQNQNFLQRMKAKGGIYWRVSLILMYILSIALSAAFMAFIIKRDCCISQLGAILGCIVDTSRKEGACAPYSYSKFIILI